MENAPARHRPSNADAVVLLAETMLAHGPSERDGGERYQLGVVVDAAVLAGADHGRCEVEGGPGLDADTARMLACDARVVGLVAGEGDQVLSVGRETRVIPRRIRRALRFRDKGCRFPGCAQTRWVDGHHIVHWAEGGETSLPNLVLLCRFHHRAIHARGFGVNVHHANGQLLFTTPAGDVLPSAPPPEGPVEVGPEAVQRRLGMVLGATAGVCGWDGAPFDLGLAVDALLSLERRN